MHCPTSLTEWLQLGPLSQPLVYYLNYNDQDCPSRLKRNQRKANKLKKSSGNLDDRWGKTIQKPDDRLLKTVKKPRWQIENYQET